MRARERESERERGNPNPLVAAKDKLTLHLNQKHKATANRLHRVGFSGLRVFPVADVGVVLTGSRFFWNSSWIVLITAGTWSQSSMASVPAGHGPDPW